MKPARVLIVEDESLVAMDMADMLGRMGYEVLANAYNYDEAIKLLEENTPDLVLLDINLGGDKTGLDLAQHIRLEYDIPFVFITSHSDKAMVGKAMALKPNAYLVKPFGQEDLFTSIEVALANFTATATVEKPATASWLITDSVFVKTDTRFVKVPVSDILYLQSDGNYIYIFTDKTKHIVRSSFRDFLVNLPAEHFIQVHKSYIVHLHKIEAFTHSELSIGKENIPLSRNFKDELFERIKRIQ